MLPRSQEDGGDEGDDTRRKGMERNHHSGGNYGSTFRCSCGDPCANLRRGRRPFGSLDLAMHLQSLQQHHCFFSCLGYLCSSLHQFSVLINLWNLARSEWRAYKGKLMEGVTVNEKLESKLANLELIQSVYLDLPRKDLFLPLSHEKVPPSFYSSRTQSSNPQFRQQTLDNQKLKFIGRWLYLLRSYPVILYLWKLWWRLCNTNSLPK